MTPRPRGIDPLRPQDPARTGPYRLLGRLGGGGIGEVYLGRDLAGRVVAVTLVHDEYADDPGFRTRFAREIRIARSIPAARTAAVVEADPDAPTPWLATEYIPGPSLERLVTAAGPIAEPYALVLASWLAETLSTLHELGVAHGDLKPSNVLITADGPRLIDFGIARAADATSTARTGTVPDGAGYLSPEQALGGGGGPASDVYSLAAVVVFAVTGRSPFGTAGLRVAVLRRTVVDPPDLRGVPGALRRLLEPCLAKDPASRPTAADLGRLLAPHRPDAAWPPPGSADLVPQLPVDQLRERGLGRRMLVRGAVMVAVSAVAMEAADRYITALARSSHGGACTAPPKILDADTEGVRWTFDGRLGSVDTVSAGAGIVIADGFDLILALDARDGRPRWQTQAPPLNRVRPRSVCAGSTCFSHDDRGIFALDAATGGLRWEQRGAELVTASATMVIGRTAGVARTGAEVLGVEIHLDHRGPRLPRRVQDGGDLFGIDPGTGTTRWRYPVLPGIAVEQVAASEDHVLVGRPGDSLTGLDAATGTVRWEIREPDLLGGNGGLAIHEGVSVVSSDTRVTSLDARSGARRWAERLPGGCSAPTAHGGMVFMHDQRHLYAWDVETGRRRWSTSPRHLGEPTMFDVLRPPVGVGPLVHVVEAPGRSSGWCQLDAFDAAEGTFRWSLPIPSGHLSFPPLAATDDSVCIAILGNVHALGR